MANEHTLKVQKTIPVSMTCSDTTAITKGSVLTLSDPNTVAQCVAAADKVAGIAYVDKIANDGVTKIAVLEGPGDRLIGIASGSITVGDALVTAVGPTNNYLASITGASIAASTLSASAVIGYALETATVGQLFLYKLNITTL
jgi:hypothetical protein